MDENKRLKLIQVHYEVQSTCVLCPFSLFFQGDWGVCTKHTYEHMNHHGVLDSPRGLCIHKSGVCSDFVMDDGKLESLHEFRAFLPTLIPPKKD